MQITALNRVIELHQMWLADDPAGVRADLMDADLRDMDLRGVDLTRAKCRRCIFTHTNLEGAKFTKADLGYANFMGANLQGANMADSYMRFAVLQAAHMSRSILSRAQCNAANMRGADLTDAIMRGTFVCDADFMDANLQGADMSLAQLEDAKLEEAKGLDSVRDWLRLTPREGEFTGWKQCRHHVIVELNIPATARRSNSTSRKCRAEYAEVVSVHGNAFMHGNAVAESIFDHTFVYRVGKIVRPNFWDPRWWVECSSGIHFFMTREEAEAYVM